MAADPLREPAVLLADARAGGHGPGPRGAADRARVPHAARRGDRARPVTGAGRAGTRHRRRRCRRGPRAEAAGRPTTRLIGREAEVAALHRLLAAERLVTLVGPGGVGKTRVALEVARAGEAPPVLLLAPVTDPAAIPHALAAALNLNVVQGDVLAACLAVLGDRPGLLVVDNCEHLLDAVRDTVGAILAACPRLGRAGHQPRAARPRRRVRLPAGPAAAAARPPTRTSRGSPRSRSSSTAAARVRPGPPVTPDELRLVADIVRRLDGMPLAIELAAGRLSTFSLADLRDRLDRSLDLLGGGRPAPTPGTGRCARPSSGPTGCSSEDEQRLFRHLAVFVDGVDLDAAERLAADLGLASDPGSVLARLVDASMIEAEFAGGGTRYRMLETLRAFGLDRLAAAGEDEAAADHGCAGPSS